MTQNIYRLEGMTCQSCVKTVTDSLLKNEAIKKVKVDFENKTLTISSPQKMNLIDLKKALSSQYKIDELNTHDSKATEKTSKWITYKPLLILVFFILGITTLNQLNQNEFHFHEWMNHFMAGFFVSFSFFKFLNLRSFSESFSSYDPIAQIWTPYGKLYPFMELTLGIHFFIQKELLLVNSLTILILSLTTFGILKSLRRKNHFKCACLGSGFNLPLSYVTVFENGVMILMASLNLFLLLKN